MPDRDSIITALESDRAIDILASIEHERWAHWQQYMHQQCSLQSDGSLLIPADLVLRWERQMATNYKDLSPDEQRSDREQVYRYLPTVIEILSD